MDGAVELLKELLTIRSVNGRDDEGAVAEYLCKYFEQSGISAHIQRIDATHANVLAELEGESDDAPIFWNGHLDTVPYGDTGEWKTDPAVPVERDGFLYGRGASDMKSGLAAMVYALCEYKKSGRPVPHTIYFLGTCDEEKGGIGAREILKEVPETSIGTLLIGEPTGCRLGVAQKGCLWLEIEAHGKTSHGAYPQEGCNAVEQAMALTGEIETYVKSFTHPVLGASTAQVTQISGGVAPNMTPDTCRILMDIRMTPGLTSQMVVGQAEAFAAARSVTSEEKFRVSCRIVNDRRAIEIGESHPLVKQLSKGLEKKELPVETTGINFFTDASILVEHKLDAAVLLFGPGEAGMAHKPNERVEIEKYQKSIQVLMDLIASEVDE